jgi:hypothetical protein
MLRRGNLREAQGIREPVGLALSKALKFVGSPVYYDSQRGAGGMVHHQEDGTIDIHSPPLRNRNFCNAPPRRPLYGNQESRRDQQIKHAELYCGYVVARAFPYSASKRLHAFSACGSL